MRLSWTRVRLKIWDSDGIKKQREKVQTKMRRNFQLC